MMKRKFYGGYLLDAANGKVLGVVNGRLAWGC